MSIFSAYLIFIRALTNAGCEEKNQLSVKISNWSAKNCFMHTVKLYTQFCRRTTFFFMNLRTFKFLGLKLQFCEKMTNLSYDSQLLLGLANLQPHRASLLARSLPGFPTNSNHRQTSSKSFLSIPLNFQWLRTNKTRDSLISLCYLGSTTTDKCHQ